MARALAAEGAEVIIGDILEDEGAALAREIGDQARFVRLDVTREEDWIAAVAQANLGGRFSLLANNAGKMVLKPLLETDVGMFEDHFRVNQLGIFLGMKTAAKAMRTNGGGSIVNTASVAGMRGMPGGVAYSGNKWAVRGMTRVAAGELGPFNIRVNSVNPGVVRTDLTAFIGDEELNRRETQVPLGRFSTPEEIAKGALFLLSDDAATITGAELKIDGGFLL
jgi:3alpha(or 20beta)-hydroxysteroid dehydrogenase